jgi:hypothetical protein
MSRDKWADEAGESPRRPLPRHARLVIRGRGHVDLTSEYDFAKDYVAVQLPDGLVRFGSPPS